MCCALIFSFFFLSFSSPSSHVVHVRYSRCERARHVVGRCAHCATDTTIHTCPSVHPASINVRKKKRYRGVRLGPPGRQSPVGLTGPYPILYNSLRRIHCRRSLQRARSSSKLPSYLLQRKREPVGNYCR